MQDSLRNGWVGARNPNRAQMVPPMIGETERRKMVQAYSIGPRMIAYLEEIGIERLSDLGGADAEEIAFRIDVALNRKHMNRLGLEALRNLIEPADRERN
jgi:hypothetical protein